MSDGAWVGSAVLLTDGVFTGAIISIAWERVPAWRDMPVDHYRTEFRHTLRRMDPAMPVLALVSAVLGIWLATIEQGWRSTSAWTGSLLVILVVGLSAGLLEPVNNAFRRGGSMPDEQVRKLRRRWEHLHVSRTVVSLLAFVLLVAAAAG